MTRTAITSALAIVLSAAIALPAAANSGKDQLAAGLGVNADAYTAAELVQLREAIRQDDRSKANWIIDGGLRERVEAPGRVTPSMAQLAAGLGVDASDYTASQLAEMYARSIAD